MEIKNRMREQLHQFMTDDHPLGPIDAQQIDNDEVATLLFEEENRIYQDIRKSPAFVIGRKGSGKSSFLNNIKTSGEFELSIEIKTAAAFTQIVRTVQKALESDGYVFIEEVADLWDILFYLAIIGEFNKKYKPAGKFKEFSSKIFSGLGLGIELEAATIIQMVLDVLAEEARGKTLGMVAILLKKIGVEGIASADDLRSRLSGFLREKNIKAVVLVDSLDDYKLEVVPVQQTIAGLLKSVGRFNVVRRNMEIRFCLPSELYPEFVKYSSNQAKDISHVMHLNWSARELVSVAAHRMHIHISLMYPEEIQANPHIYEKDMVNRRNAIRLLRHVLPKYITNVSGEKEDCLAFLLRHSHLLPRQIIWILSTAIGINVSTYERPAYDMSSEALMTGLVDIREKLWTEVCGAYSPRYPRAAEHCRIIVPELPNLFSDGDLHQVYNRFGKKISQLDGNDYHDFKRMLIEIGCVGAKIRNGDADDRYVPALFEYFIPGTLRPAANQKLCLHPMFSGVTREMMDLEENELLIYPYGSDPDRSQERKM